MWSIIVLFLKTLFIDTRLYGKCTLEHLYQLRSMFNVTLHKVGASAPYWAVKLLWKGAGGKLK